jgi:glycosyltransferase involved in cell wall biosynthesis
MALRKVCFICIEIFGWGKYGGFGRATRVIAGELAKRGIEVFAVVPKRQNQKNFEILDGIKVLGFDKYNLLKAKELLVQCQADIYHSEEPSIMTYLAAKALPAKIHLVTSRDPRNFKDWVQETIYPSGNSIQVLSNLLFENNTLVSRSVRRADDVFCTAKFLKDKVAKKYKLKRSVKFLPTPVQIPKKPIIKSEKPTVCFVSRFDRRKKPELFFNLAKFFPDVKFIAIGKSRDANYERYLKNKYSHIKNLEIPGFINQFETDKVSQILEKSWILINTSVREGLPNSFLEALAHRCAILSSVNPEDITENFGFYVKHDDFASGLKQLLRNNSWLTKGEEGQKYVMENYELNKSIDEHINIYESLVAARSNL